MRFLPPAIIFLCQIAAALAWTQVVITESDDGTLNWTTYDSNESYPQVDTRLTQSGQLTLGDTLQLGGPSPMSGSNAKTLQAASQVRAAAEYWMQWIDTEHDNDIGTGSPVNLWATWMDDEGDAQTAANATAYLSRHLGTSMFIAGVDDVRVKWSALQAAFDGNFLISPGASDPALYQELGPDKLYGLMPPPANKIKAELAALVDIAAEADSVYGASDQENPCGTTGCEANLAVATLGECSSVREASLQASSAITYLGNEVVTDVTSWDDTVSALKRLQAKGATVLQVCGLDVENMRDVTLMMEDLSFEVFALFSDTLQDETAASYNQQMTSGWYQGAWIMGATVWHQKYPTRGAKSNMTSSEFAAAFKLSSGFEATLHAASAFACLLCISAALQNANWDMAVFRENMRTIALDEFFGYVEFDEYGQNTQGYLVTQYSNISGGNATENIVYPFDKASAAVAFPRPSWVQLRCQHETAVLEAECSGNGLCDRSGACVCWEGWTGTACASEEVQAEETGNSLLLILVFSACGFAFLALFLGVACRHFWKRRQKRLEAEKEHLARAIEQEDSADIDKAESALLHLGVTRSAIADFQETARRQQSEERGIRLSYILSDEFLELARVRTGMDDPSFYDMKDKFFFGDDALGKDITCPRDGKPGVALVDWVGKEWRGKTTHFLSWTWGYKVSLVRDALQHWTDSHGINPDEVCLFMCFFVNNQYRILVKQEHIGAGELERIFKGNLTRIGRVVALLDTWDSPRYLTRIWTIFEQAMSIQLNIPVTMVLPRDAAASLVEEFNKGKDGILRVTDSLTNVHSESAEAFSPDDEKAVKALIQQGLGFDRVDASIFKFMTKWVGLEVEVHLRELVQKRGERQKESKESKPGHQVSDRGLGINLCVLPGVVVSDVE